MTTESQIAKELESLINEVTALIKLTRKSEDMLDFGGKYQTWYSRAVKLVELLGADRLAEFCGYYLADPKRKNYNGSTYMIQDYVRGMGANIGFADKPLWDIHGTVGVRIVNQSQILASLKSRLDSVVSDVRGHLLAEIEDDELAAAEKLLKISLRAAGAVAGVVLEAHLQRVSTNHGVRISKKDPTVADLNDPLKAAGVYDIPTWRKIQHLADVRNLCDHKKGREPTDTEVQELISGVASIVKTVF